MAEVHLDHPGAVTWFGRHGPAEVIGPCPHGECTHEMGDTIAWGPDYEHYTLTRCVTPGGCEGQCRAWQPEWPPAEGPGGRTWAMPKNWLRVRVELP